MTQAQHEWQIAVARFEADHCRPPDLTVEADRAAFMPLLRAAVYEQLTRGLEATIREHTVRLAGGAR
jgi:hypothetical protein